MLRVLLLRLWNFAGTMLRVAVRFFSHCDKNHFHKLLLFLLLFYLLSQHTSVITIRSRDLKKCHVIYNHVRLSRDIWWWHLPITFIIDGESLTIQNIFSESALGHQFVACILDVDGAREDLFLFSAIYLKPMLNWSRTEAFYWICPPVTFEDNRIYKTV